MFEITDLFQEGYYLALYPDVAQAVSEGIFASGLDHFLRHGLREGRDPSALYDVADIEAALAENPRLFDPVDHTPLAAIDPITGTSIGHPLDPLSAAEISQVVEIIQQNRDLTDAARFSYITLQEPPKAEVLAFTPGHDFSRKAFTTVYEIEQNRIFEAVVDLNTQAIASWQEVSGGQPPLLWEDFETVDEIVRNDPRWQAAMRRRGIENLEDVIIDGWAPGLMTEAEKAGGARLIRGLSYLAGDDTNFYGRPIEGIIVTVDLNSRTVDNVLDTGVISPISDEYFGYDTDAIAPRPEPAPLQVLQPEGADFTIQGNEVSWQNWRFRFSLEPREGLVLHQVSYQDSEEERPILYRAGLSEMVVPYADPDPTWSFRNAFDFGEYGLGRLANTMALGREVPEHGVLLDTVFADDFGEPYVAPSTVGIYERDGGLLWGHYDYLADRLDGRRGRELVVTTLLTVGNYDYGFNWIFGQDGSLKAEVMLTGILLIKGTTATDVASMSERDRYATLVASNLAAVNHQHFFNFRLDFDVDGTANSVEEVNVLPAPAGPGNPRSNAFFAEETLLTTEQEAIRRLNWKKHRHWEVLSHDRTNALGSHTAFALEPEGNAMPFALPDAEIRQQAVFTENQLWVTRFNPLEQYAAGNYPNQGLPGEGLPQWVADNQAIVGEDIVLWYTMGVSHIPRPEDWPIMPVERASFRIIPSGFFDRNPALDVPPTAVS
ncbi:primary-amine oxidase [Trichothermofontia sp.]